MAAPTNEAGTYENQEKDVEALNGRLHLLFIVCTDWRDYARRWGVRHAPQATVRALGKHMMFRERADAFDAILDGYLAGVESP